MGAEKDKIVVEIQATVDELNELLDDSEKVDKNLETELFGQNSPLDSMGLVNFVVTLEERLASNLGLNVQLANSELMSSSDTPVKSISELAVFIEKM